MNMKLFTALLALFFASALTAQEPVRIKVAKEKTVDIRALEPDYGAALYPLQPAAPGGDTYAAFLQEQKRKVRARYPLQGGNATHRTTGQAPIIGTNLLMYRPIGQTGNTTALTGGHPNDNALGVNAQGLVFSAINSSVWAYDPAKDSLLLPGGALTLANLAGTSFGTSLFDPRIMAVGDRFILVFLRDNNPNTSRIYVLFSVSSDLNDGFHLYTLPGNPDGAGYWTDFPAMAVSENELYITGNLIQSGVSWQLGFRGSLIWQIGLNEGFNGADSLNIRLYTYVKHNNKLVRNLLPVKETHRNGDGMYFLSNRNFDVSNDTVFLVHLPSSLQEPAEPLTVVAGVSATPYGVPPNGRQANTNTADPTDGLQTNDARPLGAIRVGNTIQFVGNTVNPATGFSAVYHGLVDLADPLEQSAFRGTILGSPDSDYGYPEISYTGDVEEACDGEAIIGFNFTSPTRFPGVACVYYNNDSTYSPETVLKNGEALVAHFPGTAQRWGDYFGIQTRPGHPKEVWTAGYFGRTGGKHATWITQLFSPDSALLKVVPEVRGATIACNGQVELQVSGQTGSISVAWQGHPEWDNLTLVGPVCSTDTLVATVSDALGCSSTQTIVPGGGTISSGVNPNPFGDYLLVGFDLPSDAVVVATLYNLQGQRITDLVGRELPAGRNELVFHTGPLIPGTYVLRLSANGEVFLTQKVIKAGSR